MNWKMLLYIVIAGCLILVTAGCDTLQQTEDGDLTASGFIAADQVRIATEIGGRVLTINVVEGDRVNAGDVLFSIDDELLNAQSAQVQTTIDLAQAAIETANAQLQSAETQYDLVVQQARMAEAQQLGFTSVYTGGYDLPAWYFEKTELLAAAEAEVDQAQVNMDTELANLTNELAEASNEDFVAVETRLAQAQIAFEIAELTLQQAEASLDQEELVDAAQKLWDSADAELDAAQLEYDRMLSSSAAETVLEARARVAAARLWLDTAIGQLASIQTGEESLQVQSALSAVNTARTAITQAEANLAQAEAGMSLIELQIQKCQVTAPIDGTIVSLNIEAGELVAAGTTLMTIAQLDEVTLTVYVPEDEYGRINLGQAISIYVDSYPNKEYTGIVQSIADEAEFTPRNVQTVEGRKSTVFAVTIRVPNEDDELKPGMPADVNFNLD